MLAENEAPHSKELILFAKGIAMFEDQVTEESSGRVTTNSHHCFEECSLTCEAVVVVGGSATSDTQSIIKKGNQLYILEVN